MSETQTIIQIIAESERGVGYSTLCANPAAAQYYLAQLAGRHQLPLETIVDGRIYQIGHINYLLAPRHVLGIPDVGALRRAHED